jgi:hypothetical protein
VDDTDHPARTRSSNCWPRTPRWRPRRGAAEAAAARDGRKATVQRRQDDRADVAGGAPWRPSVYTRLRSSLSAVLSSALSFCRPIDRPASGDPARVDTKSIRMSSAAMTAEDNAPIRETIKVVRRTMFNPILQWLRPSNGQRSPAAARDRKVAVECSACRTARHDAFYPSTSWSSSSGGRQMTSSRCGSPCRPVRMNHFALCKGETDILVYGIGPRINNWIGAGPAAK